MYFKPNDIVECDGMEIKVYHMTGKDTFAGEVINNNQYREIGYVSDRWDANAHKLKYRPKDSTDLLLEIKQELEVIKKKLNKAISKPERWRANIGDYYYYIDWDFEIVSHREAGDDSDDFTYSTGNYFQTIEEAQKYADRIKQLLLNREL